MADYWVDKLGSAAALRLALVRMRDQRGTPRVFYLYPTSHSRAWTRFLARFGLDVAPAPLRSPAPRDAPVMGDHHSDDGSSIRYAINACVDEVIGSVVTASWVEGIREQLANPHRSETLRVYLETRILPDVLDNVACLFFLRAEARKHQAGDHGETVYLLERTPFTAAVLPHLSLDLGERILVYGRAHRGGAAWRVAAALVRQSTRAGFHRLRVAVRPSAPTDQGIQPAAVQQPKIAVQSLMGLEPDRMNDLIWHDPAKLGPSRILFYLYRPEFPASSEAKAEIFRRGMSWVELYKSRPQRSAVWYWRAMWGVLLFAVRWGFHCLWKPSVGRWSWRFLVDLERMTAFWGAFLREYDVKVLMDYAVASADIVPKACAVEGVGGIYVHPQVGEAYFEFGRDVILPAHHVYLAWGPTFREKLHPDRAPDIVLDTGQFVGKVAREVAARAKERRMEIFRRGCDYAVGVFDNHPLRHCSPRQVDALYDTVVAFALRHPKVGLIVKPKPSSSSIRTRSVGSKFGQLEAEGRVIVLEPRVSIVEAALSCDITVGIPLCSAVFQAAAVDVPGIHLDLAGVLRHPLYRMGRGKLVAEDSSTLLSMLERHYEGDRQVGDHGPHAAWFDAFHDGRAHERASQFLRWFLDAVEAGETAPAALRRTVHRYTVAYGEASVTMGPRLQDRQRPRSPITVTADST